MPNALFHSRNTLLTGLTVGIAAVLLILPILVIIGWADNITLLKSIFPGIVSMNPTVAVCFFLAGTSLLLMIFVEKRWVRIYVSLVALIIFTAGFARMLGILNILDLHLDQILFHQQMMQVTAFSNNRIAPNTAFNLMLIGVTLFLLVQKRFLQVVQIFSSLTFLIALLAIAGYIYEVHNLYGFLSYTPMALNTALCFCLVAVGILCILPEGFFMDIVVSNTPGGLISRRQAPTTIVMPLFIGYIVIQGIQSGYYDANYAIALLVVSIIAIFLLILLAVVYRINLIDRGRLSAEEQAEQARVRAEMSSKELDAKLKESEQQNKFLTDTKRAMLNLVEDLNTTKKDLEQEKNKDEALLESIGDAVFAVDEEGKIILFNPVAEQLSGTSTKEAIGKHYREVLRFIQEDTGKESFEFITQALEGKKASMANQTMLVNAQGVHIPVADSASPLMDNSGTITGAVVVFRDVTHDREVDKAKTEFVSLASHQLRTPLSAIGWYAELLLDGDAGKVTKKQAEFLAQISESNKRMVELVNSLLNVSRIDMGTLASDPKDTDIISLTESVFAELAPQIAEHKLAIVKEYSEKSIMLVVDPQLMRIIIQNLLSNAVKYTPEKGTITISISKDTELFHLSVADTGFGIPQAQQSKIFTKLFRADNAKEKITDGNGLGLYVVKSVIDSHDGKIWFESKENEGTKFFVELPAHGMKKVEGSKTLS